MKKKQFFAHTILLCNFMSFSLCAAFIIDQSLIDQGLVIADAGEWILNESIVISDATRIFINVDNVVFNVNGHTIQARDNAAVGIELNTDNCVIKDGAFEGFTHAALSLSNVSSAHISNVCISKSNIGIQVKDSSCIELQNIQLKDIGHVALTVQNSEYVNICATDIKNSLGDGIVIQGQCLGCSLSGLHIDTCENNGLIINADGVQCAYVTVRYAGHDGVVINGSDIMCHTIISLYNNGSGFAIVGSRIVFHNCTAGYNAGDGVMLDTGSTDISIVAGQYALNTMIGIRNNGSSLNKALCAQVYQNKKRDLYRIMNSIR